jgi:hypothetical protein
LLKKNSPLFLAAIAFSFALVFSCRSAPAEGNPAKQFILLNRKPNSGWREGQPQAVSREEFLEIKNTLPDARDGRIRIGIGFIFSYFRTRSDDRLLASLQNVLRIAEETDTPILIQLDGEQWWEARPDLWNWWDPSHPGFNPANRKNVEWSGWTEKDALKIAWRNWGQQFRVRPPPNLMSTRYRKACHEKMELLIPVIIEWWKKLPAGKKDLLVGIKVGWESSIGVNAWHYPNGNALLEKPSSEDPDTGPDGKSPPARGMAQIGYAAVKTAGIRKKGTITEADLAEVVRRHLEDLSRKASRLGVPREKLFTHGVGWKEGELSYQAAVNKFSCPGWSFYRHARDPRQDIGVQEGLRRSDAPYWAATEWLFQGGQDVEKWRDALENTLSYGRCRYVCIYNWEGVQDNPAALEAIRQIVTGSSPTKVKKD